MRMRHGFTLVEILIVVVLLGILATLVVPRFAGAADEAREVKIGAAKYPPGDESTGWYFSAETRLFWPNSKQTGKELWPLIKLGATAAELPAFGG